MEIEEILKKDKLNLENVCQLIVCLREEYHINCDFFLPIIQTSKSDNYVLMLDGIYFHGGLKEHSDDLILLVKELKEQEKIQSMKRRKIRSCLVGYLKEMEKETQYNFSVSIGVKS